MRIFQKLPLKLQELSILMRRNKLGKVRMEELGKRLKDLPKFLQVLNINLWENDIQDEGAK